MQCLRLLIEAHGLARHDPAAAEAICDQAIAAEPENGFALHLLGVLRLRRSDNAGAIPVLRRAVAARPEHAEGRLALAEALIRAGADEDAAGELDRIVAARPDHADALSALAMVRLRLGAAASARDLARRAVAAAPDAVEPALALGTALSALRDHAAARAALQRAVELDPLHGRACLNLGNVLLDLDEEDAAERHIRRATELEPGSAEAWASLGFVLAGADRLQEAMTACDRAIALRPDFPQAHWNRSFAALRAGAFDRGWADYEWRFRHKRFGLGTHVLPGREWDGSDPRGQRILVNATQGLGDTIQLARYLPPLVELGAAVTVACPSPLLRLLAPLPVRLIPSGGAHPPYDAWVDQMSLPRLFGTTPDNIPAAAGYLSAPRPPRGDRLRVGLVCAGNPLHSNDFRRSMRPADMAPLGAVGSVAWASLQLGPARNDLAALFGVPALTVSDMAETAAIIAGLDLVIAVDTALAHLAGALGVPVWILLPRAPDWRWLAGRDDSPWYASARLFRQPRAGEWGEVIARVTDALRGLVTPT